MENRDVIEVYHNNKMVARLYSSMVLPVGGYINIRGRTYEIKNITFAIDHSDDRSQVAMRCNVDVELV